MTFTEFKHFIEKHNEFSSFHDTLYELNVDITESTAFSYVGWLEAKYIRDHFTEYGVDWVEWWLYEHFSGRKTVKEDGKELDVTSIEDFWKFLSENEYIK